MQVDQSSAHLKELFWESPNLSWKTCLTSFYKTITDKTTSSKVEITTFSSVISDYQVRSNILPNAGA